MALSTFGSSLYPLPPAPDTLYTLPLVHVETFPIPDEFPDAASGAEKEIRRATRSALTLCPTDNSAQKAAVQQIADRALGQIATLKSQGASVERLREVASIACLEISQAPARVAQSSVLYAHDRDGVLSALRPPVLGGTSPDFLERRLAERFGASAPQVTVRVIPDPRDPVVSFMPRELRDYFAREARRAEEVRPQPPPQAEPAPAAPDLPTPSGVTGGLPEVAQERAMDHLGQRRFGGVATRGTDWLSEVANTPAPSGSANPWRDRVLSAGAHLATVEGVAMVLGGSAVLPAATLVGGAHAVGEMAREVAPRVDHFAADPQMRAHYDARSCKVPSLPFDVTMGLLRGGVRVMRAPSDVLRAVHDGLTAGGAALCTAVGVTDANVADAARRVGERMVEHPDPLP